MLAKKQPHLDITIVDGSLRIEGFDFEGKGCHELAELFSGLGDTTETRRKPDYFRGAADQGVQTIRNR